MGQRELTKTVRGEIELTEIEVEELNILKAKCENIPEFAIKSKYISANIPKAYWDIDWKAFRGDSEAKKLVQAYCKRLTDALELGQGLILTGLHGTGKTTLACLIGKEALTLGFTVRYTSVAKVLSMIMDSFDSKIIKQRLETIFERIEILILDDLGKEYKGVRAQLTPMMSLKLDSILRERINRNLITIVTTNFTLQAIKENYGDSILSIFYGSCHPLEVKGQDYRRVKSKKFWDGLK